MSVALRCPSCSAKLRLDEAPPLGTMIDCPKCGAAVPIRTPLAEEEPAEPPPSGKKGKKEKKGKKPRTVVTEPRTFMNEFALLGIVGAAMLALMGVLFVVWFILNRAAKVEDFVAIVPDDYPVLRGVYLDQMKKMPGYQSEVDAVFTKEMQEGYAALAKGLGAGPKDEKMPSYLIIARTGVIRGQGVELFYFRTKQPFDPGRLDKVDGLKVRKDPAQPSRTYRAFDEDQAQPFLKGAVVVCPNKTTIIVARNDPVGTATDAAADVARGKPGSADNNALKKIGTVGRQALKAHFWTIVRPVGAQSEFMDRLGGIVGADKEFDKLAKAVKASKVLAVWTTFGATGLRCGAGIECGSDKEAKEVVTAMKEGPLGKAEESEAPNGLRYSLQIVGMKKLWGEFLQSLSFHQSGPAAYIKVKVDTDDNRRILYDYWVGPFGETPAPVAPIR